MFSKTVGGKFSPGTEIKKWNMPRFGEAEEAPQAETPETIDYTFVPFYGGEQEVAMTLEDPPSRARAHPPPVRGGEGSRGGGRQRV